jgi:large subunit ribosomal protein L31
MRKGIHPKYYPNAQVTCSCGNTWTTGSTKESLRTDVCNLCHPFFTGEQRIVDTAGQVDRFVKRLERKGEIDTAEQAREQAEIQAEAEKKARRRKFKPEPAVQAAPVLEAVAEAPVAEASAVEPAPVAGEAAVETARKPRARKPKAAETEAATE